jgi:hypothetical protein
MADGILDYIACCTDNNAKNDDDSSSLQFRPCIIDGINDQIQEKENAAPRQIQANAYLFPAPTCNGRFANNVAT